MNETVPGIRSDYYDRSCVEIDLDALSHNFGEIKRITSPGTGILAVVKADAYGHGAYETATTLLKCGAAGLCLATIDEAVDLRLRGIEAPMMILGFTDKSRFADAVRYNIEQAVYSYDIAKALSDEAVSQGKQIKIHIKLDTGMGRIGFKTDGSETSEIVKSCALPGIIPYGVFSHFAVADTDDDEYTYSQYVFWEASESSAMRGTASAIMHITATITNRRSLRIVLTSVEYRDLHLVQRNRDVPLPELPQDAFPDLAGGGLVVVVIVDVECERDYYGGAVVASGEHGVGLGDGTVGHYVGVFARYPLGYLLYEREVGIEGHLE